MDAGILRLTLLRAGCMNAMFVIAAEKRERTVGILFTARAFRLTCKFLEERPAMNAGDSEIKSLLRAGYLNSNLLQWLKRYHISTTDLLRDKLFLLADPIVGILLTK